MSSGIRVGLVGFGLGGQAFHAPLISATEGLELTGIVTSRGDLVAMQYPRAEAVGAIDELLCDEGINLVVISSPDELHVAQAVAALEAGKNVVVDKPFASNVTEAERIVAAARASGRIVSVFHSRRWDADFLTLRGLVEAGILGEIRQFHSHFDRFRPVALDRWKDRRAGGVWQDLGPHLIDQALQLFGLPEEIMADIFSQKGGAPDYAHVVLRYPVMRVMLYISQSAPDHRFRFRVHGTRGSYCKDGIDPQEAQALSGLRPSDTEWGVDGCEGMLSVVDDAGNIRLPASVPNLRGDYPAFYVGVRDAILGRGPNPAGPEQALDVMRVIDAGLRSASKGCAIRL